MDTASSHPRTPRRRRRIGLVAATAAGLSLVATTAWAAVAPGDDPNALAGAIVGGAPLTGASLSEDYTCGTECPTGVGTTPLAGFPTNGATFGILTSGDAALADQPNSDGGSGLDWSVDSPAIGPTVHDAQVLRIDLGAATGSCLAFDFRFLSEEYPEYVTAGFNDAFVAQLNAWSVTADPGAQTISAPGDFAAGAGDTISVDASGPSAMSEAQAAGTTYDGATLPLVARTPVAAGSANTLYLTIFDQGDGILDTAVLVDNLRYETLPPGQCKSLAVEPFEGATGVSLTPGATAGFAPGYTSMSLPLTCNLPPGPLSCDVTATSTFTSATAAASRTAARATTALGSGSVSIKGGATGTMTLTSTPAGIAAVKAAAEQPAKLRKAAKKMLKKAKKLQKKAKASSPAKAKKLVKKAKKLQKKAKRTKKQAAALARQPLGTVAVTVSNPANGTSGVLTVSVPR